MRIIRHPCDRKGNHCDANGFILGRRAVLSTGDTDEILGTGEGVMMTAHDGRVKTFVF